MRYSYNAFGELSATGGVTTRDGRLLREANPFRYASYQYDEESKFYYLKSRYYIPFMGRFLTRDKVSGYNLYAYCENNPVNLVDPDGYFWIRAASAAAGATIFGIVAYLVADLFNLSNDLKLGAVAIFATIGGVLGGIFGPSIISQALPKLTRWLKEIKRTTKFIKPKGESLGGIVIMNKVRIMLHLPHLKNPMNPHKYLHLQIEVFSFKWRIPLQRSVK